VNAEIVSVGTELLLGQIVDTHAPLMARILAECGVGCTRRVTVGDNLDRLVAALKQSLENADLVVTIGGLGPTVDDLTRDGIAKALGDELVHMPDYEQELRDMVKRRGFKWVESFARQAYRPASAQIMDNPYGSAPGLIAEKNGKIVMALPGPKGEFDPMAQGPVRDFLRNRQGGEVIHSRTLRIVGMGESHVEELVRPLMDSEQPTVAPYAHPGEVHLRVTAKAHSVREAEEIIAPMEAKIREILGDAVFSSDGKTLEQFLVDRLAERGETLAIAESITGGSLAARITSVPGASKVFLGGVVAYSWQTKMAVLGVSESALREHGAVSEQVAQEMATRMRAIAGTTYALATTGNAGPTTDGDSPVGLVFTALAGPFGATVLKSQFRSDRGETQRRAGQTALTMLRELVDGK
jgi:nicotinamide-nucleotide amidase